MEAASHLDAMTAYWTFNGRGRYVSDYPDIDSQTSRPGDRSSTERQFGRDAAGVLAGAGVTPQVSDAACAGLPLCAGRRPVLALFWCARQSKGGNRRLGSVGH